MRQFKPGQLQTGSLYNISASYAVTSSYSMNGGGTSIDTGSLVTTSSFNAFTASYTTGSFTGSFTGTFNGTASWASNAITASYYAGTVTTASYASTASYVLNAVSSSYATTASYATNALSASYAPDTTFPYSGSALITGSLRVTGSASILAFTSSAASIFTIRNSANNANLFQVNGDSTAAFGNTIYSNVGLTLTSTKQYNGYFEGGTTGIYVANNLSANTSKGIEVLSRITNLAGSGISSTGVTTTADGGSTTSAHYGLRANAYGLGTNVAGYFDVTGGVNNYAIIAQRGFSGFGQTAPAAMVDIKAAGALSTDIAFRVRNSIDNISILTVRGDRSISFFADSEGINFTQPTAGTAKIRHYAVANSPSHLTIQSDGAGGSIGQIRLDALDGNTPAFTVQRLISGLSDLTGSTLYSGFGTNAAIFTMKNALNYGGIGIIPTGTAVDHFAMYSADINGVNGTASPNFRTEDGSVLWLGTNSKLLNLTASRTIISSSQNTASGSSLTVYGSGSALPVFTVQGSQGELFSVTDSLSGSLFSVNDISGLPILEVFSDNTTLMGNYQDPMLITTAKTIQTNSGSFVVYSLPTASYDTAFFEYSIRSGSNARAGTIMAIQSGSAVNFTETTTTDFGNTSAVSFGVFISGSNMALTGSSTSGAWTTKCIVRGI